MGVYMGKPVLDKVSSDFENDKLKAGASSMQGWRVTQEDAHNCCLDFDEDTSLFAVYDGHGGHEVAEYAASHLPPIIKGRIDYSKNNFKTALQDAFLEFDEALKDKEVVQELKIIASSRNNSLDGEGGSWSDEDDEEIDNLELLRKESRMPISDLMAKYTGVPAPSALLQKIAAGERDLKPISPFLKGKQPSSSGDGEDKVDSSTSKEEEKPALLNGTADSHDGEGPSGSGNGEVGEGSSSTPITPKSSGERLAKKKASISFQKTLEDAQGSDESDSDNDESYNADNPASSEEKEENPDKSEETVDAEEEDEEEEEEDEEEDEDDDDEDDEEEEEDEEDSEFENGMMDQLKDVNEPGHDSGCTAVVCLIHGDKLFVANAGDSRAVLSRDGVAIDLSFDHKPEDEPEMQRIVSAGGRVTTDGRVNGGLNLSRALGDHTYKQDPSLGPTKQMIIALPDVHEETVNFEKDEFVVLACDGIWNSMSSQEVVDFVRPLISEGEKLSVICEKLFDICLAPDTRGDGTGCDNMTCVIVQFLKGKVNGESIKRPSSPCQEEKDAKRSKTEAEAEPDSSTEVSR